MNCSGGDQAAASVVRRNHESTTNPKSSRAISGTLALELNQPVVLTQLIVSRAQTPCPPLPGRFQMSHQKFWWGIWNKFACSCVDSIPISPRNPKTTSATDLLGTFNEYLRT